MGQANKRGTKQERIKAAIERDNAIAVERAMQKHQQPRKKFNNSVMMSYAYMMGMIGNTMFYEDYRPKRNYYGPSKRQRR